MTFKDRYDKAKNELISDKDICRENRELFDRILNFQEVKLKRSNKISTLDEPAYKTLYTYIYRFRIVNSWFKNKYWKDITASEFDKVFNDLADGKILNKKGLPIKDIDSYIFKIFKSTPFKLAGLTSIVEENESLAFYKSNNEAEANFIEEKEMYLIIDHVSEPKMKLLITLAFDIGENVSSILLLQKKDCRKQYNEVTKTYEYLITLKKDTLKRTRKARSEPTRLIKSVELLDFVLKDLDDKDYIFSRKDNMVRQEGEIIKNLPLSLRSAEIFFDRLIEKLKIKTIPKGEKPTLKHIRVSMACDCIKKGWSIEEVNSRLGHSPGSRVLKPYITYLALDKGKPKIREYKENIQGLNDKMQEQKDINLLLDKRVKEQSEELEELKSNIENIKKMMVINTLGKAKVSDEEKEKVKKAIEIILKQNS